MRKIKLYHLTFFAILLSVFTVTAANAAETEQTDVYAPVLFGGVEELSAESEEAGEEATEEADEATEEEEAAADVTETAADYSEYLSDIRVICLGILFTASFGAGSLVANATGRGLNKCQ